MGRNVGFDLLSADGDRDAPVALLWWDPPRRRNKEVVRSVICNLDDVARNARCDESVAYALGAS